ncbi:GTPase-activating protein skywalker-like isoform X2 [Haliotis rufescens]|uniref:GTPase-activating protein skywalker-like isoform X2 n=1 Tax=Haliotis rufescens TaxID=6454 RepID=UPI001EAFD709|nr:GTPase-activating protein skywalker-like isoform X2 [Haliotis rufescens]
MNVNTDDPGTVQGSSTNTGVVLKDATLDSYSDGSSHIFSEFVDMDAIRRDLGQSASSFTSDDLEDGDQLSILFNLYKLGEKKQLKQLLRQSMWPADHMIRHSLWTSLCKHLLRADGDLYDEMDKELFGDDVTALDIPLPGFVDQVNLTSYHLSHEGMRLITKIVAVINHTNPDVSYSPAAFSVASLFLHYMGPSDVYNCIYALLTSKDTRYLTQTSISLDASKLVLRDLTKKYAKSAYVHIVRQSSNTEAVFENWLWWIYRDLPFSYLVKITDCFLVEGVKVLYRAVLAVLILYAKYSGKRAASNGEPVSVNISNNISRFCEKMPVDLTKFLKIAFGIRGLSRKEIKRLELKHEMYINSRIHIHSAKTDLMMRRASTHSIGVPMSRSFSGPIIMQHMKGSSVLTPDMLHTVWSWLPARLAVCVPELLFTSDEHGTSLRTVYSKIESRQQTLFFIRNTENEVFGAFCSASWQQRKSKEKNLSYFGTGETFIFTLYPMKLKYDWVGLLYEDIPNTANMFLAGDTSILTIGGGQGEAIQLDENLVHCRTEKCDTFDNDPLCEKQDFTCKVVEVYGFK